MRLHTRHKTYQLSRQYADRVHVHNGRYARAQMERGGADACAFGRGGAESTTFDQLTTDTRYQTESYNAKNAQQRVSG